MRAFILSLVFCLEVFLLQAQDCKGFYYLSNSEIQMTVYDKKDKESGLLTYKISDVSKSGGTTTASFTSEMTDEKGKSLSKGAGKYKCTGSVLFVDAKVALPQEQMSMYKDMEVKADDAFIEYPASISSGQALKDASFKMDMYKNGSVYSSINLENTNRKVVGKESITTPAGSWDCWKITYDSRYKMTIAGIGIPMNMQCTEWFAPGFGVVKTQVANKSGKLMGSTMITSVKK